MMRTRRGRDRPARAGALPPIPGAERVGRGLPPLGERGPHHRVEGLGPCRTDLGRAAIDPQLRAEQLDLDAFRAIAAALAAVESPDPAT